MKTILFCVFVFSAVEVSKSSIFPCYVYTGTKRWSCCKRSAVSRYRESCYGWNFTTSTETTNLQTTIGNVEKDISVNFNKFVGDKLPELSKMIHHIVPEAALANVEQQAQKLHQTIPASRDDVRRRMGVVMRKYVSEASKRLKAN